MSTTNTNDINQQKNILEKTRDFIHQKVATEDQLLQEKPYSEQVLKTVPTTTDQVALKVDEDIQNTKKKFNERLDEGTDRVPKHIQKEQQESAGVVHAVKNKINEATKSPDVKQREEFREKSLTEKIQDLSSGKTNENFSEIMS